jgi:sugar phosphate isomerase/epimerase
MMQAELKRTKIAVSTWSLHREIEAGRVDAVSFPGVCAERFGVHAFEFVQGHLKDDPGQLDAVRDAIHDAGGETACIAVENDFAPADPERLSAEIEGVRRWIQLAGYLEAPVVRVNTGGHKAKDPEAAVNSVVEALRAVAPDAEVQEIHLCIENHWGVSSYPDTLLRIIDEVDSEWVATCPDFGNFPDDVDRYEALERLMPRAKHVHAKSLSFSADGNEADFDYERILGIVGASRYKGFLSVEYEGKGDEYEGIARTVDLIRKLT